MALAEIADGLLHNLDEDITILRETVLDGFADVAKELAKSGKVEQEEQVRQLDAMAKQWATQISRCEQLKDLLKNSVNNAVLVPETITKLSDPNFGSQIAAEAFKTDKAYITFAEKFKGKIKGVGVGLPEDDEDVMVESQNVSTHDPLTLSALAKEPEGFPIALPCGHIYNRSTVFSKKGSQWAMRKCAVPGCSAAIPDDRKSLQEDLVVKVSLQKKKRKRVSEVQEDSLDVDA